MVFFLLIYFIVLFFFFRHLDWPLDLIDLIELMDWPFYVLNRNLIINVKDWLGDLIINVKDGLGDFMDKLFPRNLDSPLDPTPIFWILGLLRSFLVFIVIKFLTIVFKVRKVIRKVMIFFTNLNWPVDPKLIFLLFLSYLPHITSKILPLFTAVNRKYRLFWRNSILYRKYRLYVREK